MPATPAPAAAAIRALLAGPVARERAIGMTTMIPTGTTLRGLTIAGGVATVDLSGTFAAPGGELSTMGRLAEVVYTLTQFPSVSKGVVCKVDGKSAVAVFGSHGTALGHAQQRSDFESLTSPIFVDSPAAFDVVARHAPRVGHGRRLRSDLPGPARAWRRAGHDDGDGDLGQRHAGHVLV
jgi:hypothetical protein